MKPEREAPRTPELEALLDAARRPGVLDPAAEERALLAFRAVRDKGVRPSPVRWRRGRDDWRPAGERHRGRALKALVAGVAAAALGGVAVAAGKGAIPLPFGGGAEPKPGRSAPTEPGVEESVEEDSAGGREGAPTGTVWPTPSAPDAPPGRPASARDTVAHCRVYLAAVERRGTPPRGAAMNELETAAGGPEAVRAYCEPLLADEMHDTRPNPADAGPAEVKPGEKPGKQDNDSAADLDGGAGETPAAQPR
ncbi:hypothetical protein AB0F96_13330 [Streptomyces sp. NPDC023998]|uniref:hypothetical protein n=1 Tax=Streptomyces sp. NPDC023998 TaxID=3154597 RepID=UPI0034082E5B